MVKPAVSDSLIYGAVKQEYILVVVLGFVTIFSFLSNKSNAQSSNGTLYLLDQFWIGAWLTATVYIGLTVKKLGIQIVAIFLLFMVLCLSLIRFQWHKGAKARHRIHILMHCFGTLATVLLLSASQEASYSSG